VRYTQLPEPPLFLIKRPWEKVPRFPTVISVFLSRQVRSIKYLVISTYLWVGDTMEVSKEIKLYLETVKKTHKIEVKVRSKNDSKLLKILRPILELFNKSFWNGYVTTIGNTIWAPPIWEKEGTKRQLDVICHEVMHVLQSKKFTSPVFRFLYLFPQSLSVLALLSFLAIPFSVSWLFCLLFLLFLAPLPAPFRYMFELEAYRVRLIFYEYVWKASLAAKQEAKNQIINNLSKADYYYTWPFPKTIQKHLDRKEKLKNKKYDEIKKFLKDANLSIKNDD